MNLCRLDKGKILCFKYRSLLNSWLNTKYKSICSESVNLDKSINLKIKLVLTFYLTVTLSRYPNYDDFENKWSLQWEKESSFSLDTSQNKHFSMILPPPNITGDLHLGHALTISIQDALIRWHHMKDRGASIWVPGFDHAGIATQIIINKLASKETGDLTKEDLTALGNKWKQERMVAIRNQTKRLGASLTNSMEYYTLSPQLSEAVKEAFIKLHNDGIIYRDKKIINWSYYLKSTLSDIEIEWLQVPGPTKIKVPGYDKKVEFGVLHYVDYPISSEINVTISDAQKNSCQKYITISTTRLETIVGDVAVAVNPNDIRYRHYIGKSCVNPLTGRYMPIVSDTRIDPEFGTGAMKVTPSHSLIDYQISLDHNLPLHDIFNEEGCIFSSHLREDYKYLNNMSRFEAKDKIKNILLDLGLYKDGQKHKTVVPICTRSGDVIEAKLLSQWFINSKLLSNDVRSEIERGNINITPQRQKENWLKWLNDIDWCISRQISWGHQVPAYKIIKNKEDIGLWVAAKSSEEAKELARVKLNITNISELEVLQDKDVLDTWFSSAILPFSALGWPHETDIYKKFYPLSLMETGYDIIGFWVTRMALLGKKLTGKFPFKELFLHGMVCDAFGKKMTKSLGNIIDPLHVINGVSLSELLEQSQNSFEKGLLTKDQLIKAQEGQKKLFPKGIPKCGADALRLSLFQNNVHDQIIALDVKNIMHNRNIINKMWQTARFFEMNIANINQKHEWLHDMDDLLESKSKFSIIDLWILSCLASFVESTNQALYKYEFQVIYKKFHKFWVQQLCDVYIEYAKKYFRDETEEEAKSRSLNILYMCLKTSLISIHPLMPFITEELYNHINSLTESKNNKKSILSEDYPGNRWIIFQDKEKENNMITMDLILKKLRSIVKEYRLNIKENPDDFIVTVVMPEDIMNSFEVFTDEIKHFVKTPISFVNSGDKENIPKNWVPFPIDQLTIFVKPTNNIAKGH